MIGDRGAPKAYNISYANEDHALRALLSSTLFSSSGTSIGNVTILWLIFTRTNSPFDIALMGISALLPRVSLGLFIGGILNRYNKRILIALSGLIRAFVSGFLVVSLLIVGFNLIFTLMTVFVLGFGRSVSRIGTNTILPATVSHENLGKANGSMAFAEEISEIIGNPVGGVITAFSGVIFPLLLSVLLFLTSAIILLKLLSNFKYENQTMLADRVEKSPLLLDIREGISYVTKERVLLLLTISSVTGNFFTSMFLPFIVVYVTRLLSMGVIAFGILNGLIGAGFGIGALFAGRSKCDRKFPFYFTVSWGIGEILILGLVLSPQIITASLFLFLWGLCAGFGDTVFSTGIQKFIPPRLLSRFWSIDETFSLTAAPAGQASGGILIQSLGVSPVFIIASFGGSISSLILILFAKIRRFKLDHAVNELMSVKKK